MRGRDLSTPREGRRIGVHYDSEKFGAFSESIARFFGTARFLVMQTAIVIVWIAVNFAWGLNIGNIRKGGFDPYPFILLNLGLSMLAALQAPVILMSQNRQATRDRTEAAHDYEVNLKAELEIRRLHEKVDELREQQWARLVEQQQQQIAMLERLLAVRTAGEGGPQA